MGSEWEGPIQGGISVNMASSLFKLGPCAEKGTCFFCPPLPSDPPPTFHQPLMKMSQSILPFPQVPPVPFSFAHHSSVFHLITGLPETSWAMLNRHLLLYLTALFLEQLLQARHSP